MIHYLLNIWWSFLQFLFVDKWCCNIISSIFIFLLHFDTTFVILLCWNSNNKIGLFKVKCVNERKVTFSGPFSLCSCVRKIPDHFFLKPKGSTKEHIYALWFNVFFWFWNWLNNMNTKGKKALKMYFFFFVYSSHVQKWLFGGFSALGFETLRVNILGWNLVHVILWPKSRPNFFLWSSAPLEPPVETPKGPAWLPDFELLEGVSD
jgi:hypothetical protein